MESMGDAAAMTEYFHIAEWRVKEWEQTYSPLDVRQEIEKMRLWLEANPRRARKKNWARFIINWLGKAHAQAISARFERYSPKNEVVYRDQDGQRYVVTPERMRRYL